MKKLVLLGLVTVFVAACGNNSNQKNQTAPAAEEKTASGENPSYDLQRGEGKFTKVDVSQTLDVPKADCRRKGIHRQVQRLSQIIG